MYWQLQNCSEQQKRLLLLIIPALLPFAVANFGCGDHLLLTKTVAQVAVELVEHPSVHGWTHSL